MRISAIGPNRNIRQKRTWVFEIENGIADGFSCEVARCTADACRVTDSCLIGRAQPRQDAFRCGHSGRSDRRDRRVGRAVKPTWPAPSAENLAAKVAYNQHVWRKFTEGMLTENFNPRHHERVVPSDAVTGVTGRQETRFKPSRALVVCVNLPSLSRSMTRASTWSCPLEKSWSMLSGQWDDRRGATRNVTYT